MTFDEFYTQHPECIFISIEDKIEVDPTLFFKWMEEAFDAGYEARLQDEISERESE